MSCSTGFALFCSSSSNHPSRRKRLKVPLPPSDSFSQDRYQMRRLFIFSLVPHAGLRSGAWVWYRWGVPIAGQSPPQVIRTEMRKFGQGQLHSGSKGGPVVKSHQQAIAIALQEASKAKTKHGLQQGWWR